MIPIRERVDPLEFSQFVSNMEKHRSLFVRVAKIGRLGVCGLGHLIVTTPSVVAFARQLASFPHKMLPKSTTTLLKVN
jgi:hypothetical protein